MDTNKKVIVTGLKWKKTAIVDADVFEDVYVEACTQIIEKMVKNKKLNIGPTLTCWIEGDIENIVTCNSYKILINAGYHKLAEAVKQELLKKTSMDWSTEPVRSTAK
jgi:hypothetical protein